MIPSVKRFDSGFQAKLMLAFGLLIAIVVGIGMIGLRHVRADAELEKVIDARCEKVQLSRQAQNYSNLNNRITMQIFLVDNEQEISSLMSQIASNSGRISNLIEILRTKVEGPQEAQLLHTIEERRAPYTETYRRALRSLVSEKRGAEGRAILTQESLPALLKYHDGWNAYVDYQDKQLDRVQALANDSANNTRIGALVLIWLAVIVAVAIAYFVLRNLSRHVARRREAEEALLRAYDDLEVKVGERTAALAEANEGLQKEIAERKRIDEAFRESEKRYRQIVESATDTIYRITPDGYFTFVNPNAAALVKRSVDECAGLHFLKLIREDFREAATEFYRKQVEEKIPSTYFEFPAVAKDGSEVWIGQNVQLVIEGDVCVALQAIARDITTRKQIEHQLLESERQYRLLFEANPLPMWVFDVETLCFLSVNDAAIRHYGYSREEFLGMTVKDIRPAEDVDRLMQMVKDSEGFFGNVAVRHRRKDGSVIDVEVTWHSVDFSGKPVKLVLANDVTERKRAQEALAGERNLLRTLIDELPDRIYVKDSQARFLLNNTSHIQGLGAKSQDEVLGKTDFDFRPSEFATRFFADDQAVIQSGKPLINHEEQVALASGEICSLLVTKVPLRDPQDKVIGLVGISRDITERKRTEDEIVIERARFQQLFENAPMGIVVVDQNGVVLDANKEFGEIFQFSSSEILGQSLNESIVPEHLAEEGEELTAETLRGEIIEKESVRQRKDGTLVPVQLYGVPIVADQKMVGVFAIYIDLSERKRMEDEREIISEIIQGAITTSDLDEFLALVHRAIGNYLYAENCFVALYDEASELMSFPFWVDKLDPCPEPRPVGLGFSSYVLRTGKPILVDRELTEEMYQRGEVQKSGSASASWLGVPLRTASRIIGVLVVQHYEQEDAYDASDVEFLTSVGSQIALAIERKRAETTLRETEEQLRQSQKMESIGKLAGGIAHDFNNLMTAVIGYSELALRGLTEANPLRPKLDEIKKAGERAAALTSQLLAFSRKQMLSLKVIDLNAVITGMGKLLPRLIGEDIELHLELANSLGEVKADPGQIEQVVMNLAVNARDAMPRGGCLTVKTENVNFKGTAAKRRALVEPGRYVMLSVSDNGCGMDEETKKNIFEPFFTTKEIGKGTGLGLSTVYGIVKQSGGSIWVYSEPEQGTIFKIYLPRVDEAVEAESSHDESQSASGNETVLLVEDEDVVRNLSKEALEEYGYDVITAPNGKEGLRICREFEGRIDLMITDVVMPHMSGRELAEEVASLRPETRVLYMSGFTDDAVVRHGVLDDDVSFIQKPFSPNLLAIKAREVLDNGNGSRHG